MPCPCSSISDLENRELPFGGCHCDPGILIHTGQLCGFRKTLVLGSLGSLATCSILTSVWADTASPTCPAHSGGLAIASSTIAAVICDADDPCSENIAWDPESSFATSPRSTMRTVYLWTWRGMSPSALQNELSFPLFCACWVASFFELHLYHCHADKFLIFPTLCRLRLVRPEFSSPGEQE